VKLKFHVIYVFQSIIHKNQLLGYNKKDEVNCVFDCNHLTQAFKRAL